MRWTGWILATIVVGYAGFASGGQPDCLGCGGAAANQGALSGAPCCSPPGYAQGYAATNACCCAPERPCCSNAWDGYCDHRARVQAFWSRVGVPKAPRCYCPGPMPRLPMRAGSECSVPLTQRTPPAPPTIASPRRLPTPSEEAFRDIGRPWSR
jgi:hypothetical protein